jgi:hypothetical protein
MNMAQRIELEVWCLVYLLDQYLNVLPNFAFEKIYFTVNQKSDAPQHLLRHGMILLQSVKTS